MLDPIADMLTRIRNAQRAGHREVLVPASRIKQAIAAILERRGFIEKTEAVKEGMREQLRIILKYVTVSPTERMAAIQDLRRISHEGQRLYIRHADIRKVKNGYGMAVISTSKGLMTGEEAYRAGLGGEYICEVW